MYLLDTDTLSLFLQRHPIVYARLLGIPNKLIWISTITVEEVLDGQLLAVRRLRQPNRPSNPKTTIRAASERLAATVRSLAAFQILAYDEAADVLFTNLPPSVKRVGPHDCRIAASAIVNAFIVVTRNVRDFAAVPGVMTEDWSKMA